MKPTLILPLLFLLLTGCDLAANDQNSITITTDKPSYRAGTTASLTIANRTEESIFLRLCQENQPAFELEHSYGQWNDEIPSRSFCPVAFRYVELAPEAAHMVTIRAGRARLEDKAVRYQGQYRFRLYLYEQAGGQESDLLPISERSSNGFTIEGAGA